MEFEYDIVKSDLNRQKHGISLEEVKALWLVPGVEVEAKTMGEPRFLRIGKIKGKFYSCIFTIRKDNLRLISARRSRPEEEKIYEGEEIREEENEEN